MIAVDILLNPWLLGAIVFVLALLIKKLGWTADGVRSLWLTMGFAVVFGIVQTWLNGELASLPGCVPGVSDPAASLQCLLQYVESVLQSAGVVFATSQTIYQVLRRELVGKSVLGERI